MKIMRALKMRIYPNEEQALKEDIDNLSRLAFYLRHGKIKIIKQND